MVVYFKWLSICTIEKFCVIKWHLFLSLCYPGLCFFLTINTCSLSSLLLSKTNFCQFFTANSSKKEKKKKKKKREKEKEKGEKEKGEKKRSLQLSLSKKNFVSFWLQIQIYKKKPISALQVVSYCIDFCLEYRFFFQYRAVSVFRYNMVRYISTLVLT